jgi:NAD(P)-dependent dehydrogenase (short-subunit alcohol dehydrogenase family)
MGGLTMRVLITGAAHGIGAATAARLASQGATITAVDLDDPGPTATRWHRADLSDPVAIDALRLDGPFDALVNAAGLPPRDGQQARILAVNTHGLIRLTERALPHMPPGGAIVSLASKAGARWRENIAQVHRLLATPQAHLPDFIAAEGIDPVRAYDLSKETVIWWTKAQTARLLTRGLRANTVSPAAIATRILPDFESAFGPRAARGIALSGRAGTPEEVAAIATFLIHPDSAWLRGADIQADGGVTAQLEAEAYGITPG